MGYWRPTRPNDGPWPRRCSACPHGCLLVSGRGTTGGPEKANNWTSGIPLRRSRFRRKQTADLSRATAPPMPLCV
ncbi:hypothetical protein LLE87_36740, partial [Paenibacillus polymyxa]|nr:hypothetical protein [Paenibacillus polymyxa]